MEGPIKGIDRRPYKEIVGTDKAESDRLSKALLYSALGAIALKGTQIASNLTVSMDPTSLRYLHEGLSTPENPWWRVAGLQPSAGSHSTKYDVRLKDIFLEGVKRGEEVFGGIPRTFGAFGYLSRSTFTSEQSRLFISPDMLDGAWDHYSQLIKNSNKEPSPLDRVRGLAVAPHQGRPTLFRLEADGSLLEPLVDDVDISVRRWMPQGVDEKYRQIIRDADSISEAIGANRILHGNTAPFFVSKATGKVKIRSTARELLEPFLDVDKFENFLGENTSPRTHRALRDIHVLSKRMTERYMRVLDQPLEFYEELVYGGPDKAGGLLKKAQHSKAYGFFKNILGTGGNYKGTSLDMWARHAGRIGVATIGLAAAYEAGSLVTNTLLGKNLAQVGGEVIGAGERLYASLSDITGLTSLSKYQEEHATGSNRLLAIAGFGLSGFLTGHVGASIYNKVSSGAELEWREARKQIHSFKGSLGKVFKGDYTRGGKWGRIGAIAGLLLAAPMLPGAIGSSESYDEVVAKQSGETEVEVRKGRFWEFGRSDIEGEKIDYYRPGWYRRLQDEAFSDLQDNGLSDRPLSKMIKDIVDPYWKEKLYYYERPYGITGPDTSGFGPLGTLWGATIGRVLKPVRYMHEDELEGGGQGNLNEGQVVRYGRSISEASDPSLGGVSGPAVISPYSASFLAGEGVYKLTEATGLPGFIFSAIKGKLTGDGDFGTEDPVLASFADVGSIRDRFWDLNIGGAFGASEALRRMFPSERYQLDKVNPIKNRMPEWMPGPEYFKDFQHGDPYASIPEGEYRLPGSGYATRFKELKGVAPEDYPLIHQYKILADVAQYSKQFKSVRTEVERLAKSGRLSAEDQLLYEATETQLARKEQAIPFGSHEGLLGSYWKLIKDIGRLNPVEHLLPISPIHKTAGPSDPISEYETRNLYSTTSPFWGNPVEDFIKPAVNNLARIFGWDGIPKKEQERRDLVDYFDKLEYAKYKRLEAEARFQGNSRAAFSFSRKAEYTVYGADPYGNIDDILKIIPKEEKPYFREFLAETNVDKRKRILEITPDYMDKFYLAQWQKQTYAALAARGDLSSSEVETVQKIEASRSLEGELYNQEDWRDYQEEVSSGEVRKNTFADFLRGKKLTRYFDDSAPLPLPPTDWLGYDPSIPMDDIKLKVVESLGKDYHDFGLWESDKRELASKPYIQDIADELLSSNKEDHDFLLQALTRAKLDNLDIQITPSAGDKSRIILDIDTDRKKEIDSQLHKAGFRYGL